jgi:hypothetical protein
LSKMRRDGQTTINVAEFNFVTESESLDGVSAHATL